MNILGRKVKAVDIGPFRHDPKTYRADVYQRPEREYCRKGRFEKSEYSCEDNCNGLFMSVEVRAVQNERGTTDVYFEHPRIIVPPFECIHLAMLARNKRDFYELENFFAEPVGIGTADREKMKITRNDRDTIFMFGEEVVGRRRGKCAFESMLSLSYLPIDIRSGLSIVDEARATLDSLFIEYLELQKNTRQMSHEERLLEAAELAQTPEGLSLLRSRFDHSFLNEVSEIVRQRKS
jgi:hypothetical protein